MLFPYFIQYHNKEPNGKSALSTGAGKKLHYYSTGDSFYPRDWLWLIVFDSGVSNFLHVIIGVLKKDSEV